jgi:hypothetical protein
VYTGALLYLFYKHSFRDVDGIRGSKITLLKFGEEGSRSTEGIKGDWKTSERVLLVSECCHCWGCVYVYMYIA